MKEHKVGIIMNGVTGRMGTNQHLLRSIAAIMKEGGVKVSPTEIIVPDPILVGRNETKLKALCKQSGVEKYTTDLDSVMKDDYYQIYFDSQTTSRRAKGVEDAAAAGKHVYCEKPTAVDVETAVSLFKTCEKAGVKNGVVQDKLWLPGLAKLQRLIDTGFFGRIFSVTGDFGYWVFEGDSIPAQRPSWNYRKEDDGGMIIDMVCHWRYVLANLFGKIESVSCLGATHIHERVDEAGKTYKATADDAAYSTFQIEGGIVAHINSNWCTRPRRDDLFMMQVDGTKGSAVVSLRDVWFQPYSGTAKAVWNPDIPQPINFYEQWQKMPEQENFDNAFKVQWEKFLRHVVLDEPFVWDLLEGARGVQLAELALKSWEERRWIDVEDLV